MEIEKPKTLTEQVYTAIVNAILNDEIVPGTVYSELWFAEKLGISRTPVREALAQLKDEDMFIPSGARGLCVKPLSTEDARSLFEIRKSLEGYSIYRLAKQISANDPDAHAVLKKMEDSMKNVSELDYVERDHLFHTASILATDSHQMIHAYEKILVRVEYYWKVTNLNPENRRRSWIQHEDILTAIRSGDASAAFEAMLYHLDCGFENVCTMLDSNQ